MRPLRTHRDAKIFAGPRPSCSGWHSIKWPPALRQSETDSQRIFSPRRAAVVIPASPRETARHDVELPEHAIIRVHHAEERRRVSSAQTRRLEPDGADKAAIAQHRFGAPNLISPPHGRLAARVVHEVETRHSREQTVRHDVLRKACHLVLANPEVVAAM